MLTASLLISQTRIWLPINTKNDHCSIVVQYISKTIFFLSLIQLLSIIVPQPQYPSLQKITKAQGKKDKCTKFFHRRDTKSGPTCGSYTLSLFCSVQKLCSVHVAQMGTRSLFMGTDHIAHNNPQTATTTLCSQPQKPIKFSQCTSLILHQL